MAYNYAREKRKFDAEWKRKASWYRKEGMNDEDIEVTHRFDLTQFNRDRAYESRLSSVGGGLRLLLCSGSGNALGALQLD